MIINMQRNHKRHYAECSCDSSEHIIRFTYDTDEPADEGMLVIEPQLSTGGFFHRFRRAFWYVLGYKCKYGQWDETLLNPEQAKELRDFIDGFIQTYDVENAEDENIGSEG